LQFELSVHLRAKIDKVPFCAVVSNVIKVRDELLFTAPHCAVCVSLFPYVRGAVCCVLSRGGERRVIYSRCTIARATLWSLCLFSDNEHHSVSYKHTTASKSRQTLQYIKHTHSRGGGGGGGDWLLGGAFPESRRHPNFTLLMRSPNPGRIL